MKEHVGRVLVKERHFIVRYTPICHTRPLLTIRLHRPNHAY